MPASLRATGWHDTRGIYDERGMLMGDAPRRIAWKRIHAHIRANNRSELLQTGLQDIFQFGVYTGGGLRYWLDSINASGAGPFTGNIWGFDSFEGMPSEPEYLKSRVKWNDHRTDPAWQAGGLNAAEQLGIFEWPKLRATITRNIGHTQGRTGLVRGFFNESLARAPRPHMRTALLVDLDADLYTSSAEAIRFMLSTQLLRVGSYVYIDDVNFRPWFSTLRRSLVEVKRAYVELTREWELEWELLSSRDQHQHWRPVLVLVKCGKCQASVGDDELTRRLRRVQQQAEARRRAGKHWVDTLPVGHCGITSASQSKRAEGSCATGDKGVLGLPVEALDSWEAALNECRRRCEHCDRCRYVTASLFYRDCSWYHACDLRAIDRRGIDFRSMQVGVRGRG